MMDEYCCTNLKPLTGNLEFQSLKPCDLSCFSKSQLREYFLNSYNLNESLFTSLVEDKCFYQYPDRLRLPLIFYYTHTAVVYVNKLVLAGLLKERVNKEYETLFETGVDEMSWDSTDEFRMGGGFQWPAVEDCAEYRQQVKEAILDLIDSSEIQLPVTWDNPWWAIFMGMEHERIHIETSSVLIRQLPISMVNKPDGWRYGPFSTDMPVKSNPMVHVSQSDVSLGKPIDFPSYGWDNEYGSWKTEVPSFEASKYKVTNRQFLEFVNAGGYQKQDLWSVEGWGWNLFRNARHPTFWICDQGCTSGCGGDLTGYLHCRAEENEASRSGFQYRLMFDEVDLPFDWPVEVNYHEAKAFAAWKGSNYRLPTEAEQHLIRGRQLPVDAGTDCDIIYEDDIQSNLNLKYGSSTPVNLFDANDAGFCDSFGNTWDWVEDNFNGLPATESHYLYDDFSTPCFDGRHTVILGGSWMSTGDSASRFARFAFRRHFFQHCGFRLARSVPAIGQEGTPHMLPVRLVTTAVFVAGIGIPENPTLLPAVAEPVYVSTTNEQYKYDEQEVVRDIILQEFDTPPHENLAIKTADHCCRVLDQFGKPGDRLLVIGCGSGRLSTELATRGPNHILFIETSGLLLAETISRFDQWIAKNGKPDNDIIFKQFTWLPNEIGTFDHVLFCSINRCYNPKAWSARFSEILNPGGTVIMSAASRDGSKEEMAAILPDCFEFVEMEKISWVNSEKENLVCKASVWVKADDIDAEDDE